MTCSTTPIPGGGLAIVCTSTRTLRCACGRPARLLCDWKVSNRRTGTCDRAICSGCSTSPGTGKDLCPEHATAWEAWKASRR